MAKRASFFKSQILLYYEKTLVHLAQKGTDFKRLTIQLTFHY